MLPSKNEIYKGDFFTTFRYPAPILCALNTNSAIHKFALHKKLGELTNKADCDEHRPCRKIYQSDEGPKRVSFPLNDIDDYKSCRAS